MDRMTKGLTDMVTRLLAEPVVDAMMDAIDEADEAELRVLEEQNTEIVAMYAVSIGVGMRLDGRGDEEIRDRLTDVVVYGGIAASALKKRQRKRTDSDDEYRIVDEEA